MGPTGVDHNTISTSTTQTVQSGKQSVVNQLTTGKKGRSANQWAIIESHMLAANLVKHVGTDSWVMGIGGDRNSGTVAKQWVCKGVAYSSEF